MKKCEQCNKEFTSNRSDARFCSATCRVTFSRVTDKNLSVTTIRKEEKEAIRGITLAEAVNRVMRGEPSGIDIGYGKDDYTREMVEERLKMETPTGNGRVDNFKPNWYNIEPPFKSKNHFKKVVWKNL